MPVTIKDIAKAAGVSHTTVSRALNGNRVISPNTTERIQLLAKEMGYIPSAVAQSLLSRRTRTIGMVVTTIADPFIVQVVEGAERAAQEAGYSLFLSTSHNQPDQEVAVVETFQRRRVDAVIVTSSRVGNLYQLQLSQIQVPVVLINNQAEGESLRSVSTDNIQGAWLAVEHLQKLGHQRIAYLGAFDRPRQNGQRQAGYGAAMAQAGLKPNPALIISITQGSDFERGQAALAPLLTAQASAVLCFNDVMAIGLLVASRQHGLTIPAQLSIVGFDDIEPALYTTPPLTTIHQPRKLLGQLALQMTLALLNEQEVQDQILPCQLVVRGSTGRACC